MTFPRSLDWLDALAFYEIAAVMKEPRAYLLESIARKVIPNYRTAHREVFFVADRADPPRWQLSQSEAAALEYEREVWDSRWNEMSNEQQQALLDRDQFGMAQGPDVDDAIYRLQRGAVARGPGVDARAPIKLPKRVHAYVQIVSPLDPS